MEGHHRRDGDDDSPPPYHKVSKNTRPRFSIDGREEMLRLKSEKAARRNVIQMRVVIGCIIVVFTLTIIAIFYIIVLHMKQNQSEEIISKLRDEIEHQDKQQKYLLANLTTDVIKLSEQIVKIESDLEDLKNTTQDIQELKKMQEDLLESIDKLGDNEHSFQSSQLASEVSPCPGMEYFGQFKTFGVRATNFGLCVHDFFNCAEAMKNSVLDQEQSQRCCQQRFDQCYSHE